MGQSGAAASGMQESTIILFGFQLPPGLVPPSLVPPGLVPSSLLPPGQVPCGQVPCGQVPCGQLPDASGSSAGWPDKLLPTAGATRPTASANRRRMAMRKTRPAPTLPSSVGFFAVVRG
eukprot:scaffold68717_cov69-Phaeocystis_antarctica.AAC.2